MTLTSLKATLVHQYRLLLTGHALGFGPLAVVRLRHLRDLLLRVELAESDGLEAALVTPRLMPVPVVASRGRKGQRSIVFLHHSYYHFFYLAAALRRRGWDAIVINTEDSQGQHSAFYHDDDINLFDPDPERYRRKLFDFFTVVEKRFRMVMFYGRGRMSFFPSLFDNRPTYDVWPADFIRLRQRGIKIGYFVAGCNDGVAQSSVGGWSGACSRCVWQHQPQVCADGANLAWGHKLQLMCDLIATEGSPALDWHGKGDKLFREPLTTALDPNFWRPDLEIPEKYLLKRSPGELIVYHSVGNYDTRARYGRNIKGTAAIISAIDRLRSEGVPVRLEFVTNMPNREVRFLQVQADVVVDQLNYGRYGAQAREGMMLGRPTVCYINRDEPPGAARLESIETCPLVSATEETIYDVLKELLGDPAKRRAIGEKSRAFALKWHSADACAERFERVYDRLALGLSPGETRAYAEA
jgi:glycosyltransferase involved in cell wall biosynthesis